MTAAKTAKAKGSAQRGVRLNTGEHTAQELAEQRKREHDAVQLALAGATYQQIAEQLGYASKGNAWRAVHRLLARVDSEDAEALRTVEGSRLDRLQTARRERRIRRGIRRERAHASAGSR